MTTAAKVKSATKAAAPKRVPGLTSIDGCLMLNGSGISSLIGSPEYSVTVRTPVGSMAILVAPYQHPRTRVNYWADTRTGSLYLNGHCISGAPVFSSAPEPTGKTVPKRSSHEE